MISEFFEKQKPQKGSELRYDGKSDFKEGDREREREREREVTGQKICHFVALGGPWGFWSHPKR